MMINNALIQASWIAELKSRTAITNLVTTAEIREDNWKGTGFDYPMIRVRLTRLVPQNQSKACQVFHSFASILVFGEQKSSKTVDEIAGVVAEEFWGKGFTNTGVKIVTSSLVEIIPAYTPEDMDSWVSEVNFDCLVQLA